MKILNITSINFDKFSGPAASTTALSKYLQRDKRVSRLLHLNISNSNVKFSSFQIIHTRSIIRIIHLVRNYDVILLQSHYIKEYLLIAGLCVIWNKPYYVFPRGALTKRAQKIKFYKKKAGNIIFNIVVKCASCVIYLTKEERKNSIHLNRNSCVIPNGIELFDDKKIRNLTKGKLVFTYIGRVDSYHKGLDILVSALESLEPKYLKQIEINIYGPDVRNSKKNLISQIKPKYPLLIHEGIAGESKREVLSKSTFFIQPSRFEGLPMGILEALAMGLPTIATKGTNLSNEINEYGAGLGIETSNSAICEAITQACNLSNKEYQKMSKRAFDLAKDYNWEKVAEEIIEVIFDTKKISTSHRKENSI